MNKNETQRDIVHVINRAIRWRTGLQSKFPEDPRNMRAVELLRQLSLDSEGMTEAQFERVKPYASWFDAHWREAVEATARKVGYWPYLSSFPRFIDVLASQLKRQKAAA